MRIFSFINNVFSNISNKPATRLYPAMPKVTVAGCRGHLENDAVKCIYCGICEKRCPADALKVTRDPKTWTFDPYKCIVCGYCVEVCPKKSLSMNPSHGDANNARGVNRTGAA